MPGNRYVAVDREITWTPDGSTTAIDIGAYGRNGTWSREANDIDASAYGDDSVVHLVGRKDVNFSLDMLYDDDHEIEDALVPGLKGTINDYPLGNTTGNRKRTMVAWVGTANINEPDNDVASGTVEFRNASAAGMTNSVVA